MQFKYIKIYEVVINPTLKRFQNLMVRFQHFNNIRCRQLQKQKHK